MAVTQLNFYSNSDTSLIDMMNTLDGVFIGHHQVSLTNYDNTSLPAIAAGSKVENNGTMFSFTSETSISGSPSDGSVYILLVPSGDPSLGTATVTPEFTNTSPTWSDSKQGWYGTGGSANYRYLEFKLTKLSTNYYKKIFDTDNTLLYKSYCEYGYGNLTVTPNGTTSYDIPFDTIVKDDLTLMNVSTGFITIKETGFYKISYDLYFIPTNTTALRIYTLNCKSYLNTSTLINTEVKSEISPATTASFKNDMRLNKTFGYSFTAGDTLNLKSLRSVSDTSAAQQTGETVSFKAHIILELINK